jgi:hypothetical protein
MALEQHTLPDGRTVKLGRPAASPLNPKDLYLRRFLVAPMQLPKPPTIIDNTLIVKQPWGMYGNDKYGCCVFSSSAHRRVTQAAMVGDQLVISDDEVLKAYSAVTGFDPSDPSTDNGTVMVNAANWERHNPLGGDRVFAFARVKIDPQDRDLLDLATFYLGGVWFGINLPASARGQVGQVWDVADGPDGQPGSWGGHAVWSPKSGPESRDVITWASVQRCSHAFIATYADEAWSLLPTAWAQNDPFQAIDWPTLNQAMSVFGPVDPQQ